MLANHRKGHLREHPFWKVAPEGVSCSVRHCGLSGCSKSHPQADTARACAEHDLAHTQRREACTGWGRCQEWGVQALGQQALFCSCLRSKGLHIPSSQNDLSFPPLLLLMGSEHCALHGAHHGLAWAALPTSPLLPEAADLWQWGVPGPRAAL